MGRHRINLFRCDGESAGVIRMGEAADGSYVFLVDGFPLAWMKKISTGKWMYFRRGSVTFFDGLTDVIAHADADLSGGLNEKDGGSL